MNTTTIISLIQAGATDKARKDLKRESLKDRLVSLQKCMPYVNQSHQTLDFFRKHFATEIGAILTANNDLVKAEDLYHQAMKNDK